MEDNYTAERRNDNVDIVALWRTACKKWYLFAGGVLVCVALVFCYLKIATPIFLVKADILVNEDEKKSSGGLASLMGSVGGGFSLDGMIGGGSVNDEVLVISSHALVRDMVKRLELNKVYTSKEGFFKKTEHYGNSPLTVAVPESMLDTLSKGFAVKVQAGKPGGKIKVQLKRGHFKTLTELEAESFPVMVDFGEGLIIDTTSYYNPAEPLKFVAHISGYDVKAEALEKKLDIDLTNKKASAITLAIEESNIQRGKDILNTLIECYNDDAVRNKNMKAENMLAFIDDRLSEVETELHESERIVEQYKRENDLSDIDTEAKIILESNGQYRKALLEAETQYSIIAMVDSFLNRPENKYSLVPVTNGLPDKGAAEAINEYNKLLLERMRMLRTAKESNTALRALTAQIDAMRENILNTVSKAKESSNITRNDLREQEQIFKERLRGFPAQERAYMDIKRNQLIKNELYTFLMKRREESAMTLSSTSPKSRIINEAYHKNKPIAPQKMLLLLIALGVGLVAPVVYLYGETLFATTFKDKNGLRQLTDLPIAGEICHSSLPGYVVLRDNSTEPVAEMFRLLRSNLQFMLPDRGKGVMMVTSPDPGDGKSFVALNLALSMAMMGRRTVLVDLNFRDPKIANYLGINASTGLTDYLLSKGEGVEAGLARRTSQSEYLDVVAVGAVPPNPSELLLAEKLDVLVSRLRQEYDYIILDTASVEQVADTFSLTRFADATLYVCRAGYTRKDKVFNVTDFVSDGSLKNVLFVLNDTDAASAYGYAMQPSKG